MGRAYFKDYKGKSIYHVDFSLLKSETEFIKYIDITSEFRRDNIETKPLKSQLMIVDVSGSYIYGKIFQALKDVGEITNPYINVNNIPLLYI